MDWGWNTISAVVGVAAAVGAVWAAIVARAARRDVQAYRDAHWRIGYSPTMQYDGPITLRITNVGETRATDVSVKWDFDPTDVHRSAMTAELVEPGEYRDVALRGFRWNGDLEIHWFSQVAEPERTRYGTVAWKNVLGRRRSQRVSLPSTSELPPIHDQSVVR